MPVEDRLRRGLEANATSFLPQGELRLVAVHRRRRRRSMAVLAAASVAAIVLGSGLAAEHGGGLRLLPGPAGSSSDPVEPPSSATDVLTIPDGTWHRVAAGRPPLALTFLDGAWAVTATSGTGAVEVRDFGHATYDEQGRLVAASASTRCPGCEAVMTWQTEGDDLELAAAGPSDDGGPVLGDGRWTDREPLTSTAASAHGCSSTRTSPAREEDTMGKETAAALSVLVTLVAACSDDAGEAATTPAETPVAEAAGDSSGERLVESGWERQTTEDRARALGLSPRVISRYVGEDGVLPLGLKLQRQTYAIYVLDDDGEPRTYDLGSYSYDDEGRLVLTSSSTTCADCATTLGWRQEGDRLTIEEVAGRGTTPLDRLVWEGAWAD